MKLLRVRWRDVASLNGWQTEEEILDFELPVVECVGYLFSEDEKMLVLFQSGFCDEDGSKFGNPLFIPRGCVVDKEEIKDGRIQE